jgi:ABC-type transport system involved in multi-copper enzyme maturation permease subunit
MFGPCLTKELRGTSRRLRHYILRAAYVAALALFMVAVWMLVFDEGPAGGGNVYSVSRMANAGKSVVSWVVWFEFVAAHALAVILMANSVSGEIRRRTLGVLMTTPLSGWQIVTGKLLGGMCQTLLLLAISFPVLALARMLGGVPWSFVVGSICVTFTSALFVAAVTMLFSIEFASTAVVAVVSIASVVGSYMGVAFLAFGGAAVPELVHMGGPVVSMVTLTIGLFSPGHMRGSQWGWVLNCGMMGGLSLLLLALAARQVRRAAYRLFEGRVWAPALAQVRPQPVAARAREARNAPGLPSAASAVTVASAGPADRPEPAEAPPLPPPQSPGRKDTGPIRRVAGNPIQWKDLTCRRLADRPAMVVGYIIVGWFSLVVYLVLLVGGSVGNPGAHGVIAALWVLTGSLATGLLACGLIASEHQSHALPALLTTAMTDRQILWHKTLVVWRQVWPVWAILGAHALVFVTLGFLHPAFLVQAVALAVWASVLFMGLGLYLGARLRRTTTAAMVLLTVAAVAWLVVPPIVSLLAGALGQDPAEVAGVYSLTNPVVAAYHAAEGSTYRVLAGGKDALYYLGADAGTATLLAVVMAAAMAGLGAVLVAAAGRTMRERLFR